MVPHAVAECTISAGHPSRLAPKGREHLRMTGNMVAFRGIYFVLFFLGGGLNTMPSSFMPSGSVKYTA
jgi:hypothetical protein